DRNFFNYAHFGERPFAQILRARHVMRDKPGLKALVIQIDPYVVARQRSWQPLLSSRGFYEALAYSRVADIREVVGPNSREMARNVVGFAFPLSVWWERVD